MEHPLVKALKEVKYEPSADLGQKVWRDIAARNKKKASRKIWRYSALAILSFALLTQTPKFPRGPVSLFLPLILILVFLFSLKKAAKLIAHG